MRLKLHTLRTEFRSPLSHGPHGSVVVVPARTGTTPYGEAFFTTQSAVGVDLFAGTVLLQSADNGHKSCK